MSDQNAIQGKITEGIQGLFTGVISERKQYYSSNSAPAQRDVDGLISSYANEIGAATAAVNLIPGPAGMIATVPEVIAMIRKQVRMIYDIGKAYGKDDTVLTQEMLLGIAFSATGTLGAGLFVVQGTKVFLKRATLKVIQKVLAQFGTRVTQKVISSMGAKWIPLIGAGAMGLWSRSSTKSIGMIAKDVFSKEIIVEDIEEKRETSFVATEVKTTASSIDAIEYEKIKALISMLHTSKKSSEKKKDFIEKLIDSNKYFDSEEAHALRQLNFKGEKADVNYAVFDNNPEASLALLMDMVMLAVSDGKISSAESIFIKTVAKKLNIDPKDAEELINDARETIEGQNQNKSLENSSN
ncbi:MAG TPA: hypothetical protein PKL57_19725 [Candidatus Wallbacteria bacterium]|nr:hypothetical protein [Candidatus Wallbacteria bacterium]